MRTPNHIVFPYNLTSQAHGRQVWLRGEDRTDVCQVRRRDYEGRRTNNIMENPKGSDRNCGQEAQQVSRPLAGLSTAVLTGERRGQSPWLSLVLDAYAKARRARQGWQAARLAGDTQAAERARQLMLRHQAIAYHLDPDRGANHESA
jgi:hypothetical protein